MEHRVAYLFDQAELALTELALRARNASRPQTHKRIGEARDILKTERACWADAHTIAGDDDTQPSNGAASPRAAARGAADELRGGPADQEIFQ